MKKVNTLQDIQNKYPEERDLSQSYDGRVYRGIYKENKVELIKDDFSNINPIDGDFKVIFSIDGQLFSSRTYLEELQSSNNPYINKSNLAIVEFSSTDLLNAQEFSDQENYAEVSVDSTISTIDDLSKHISWLLDSKSKEIKKVTEYGQYTLRTTEFDFTNPTNSMGFEYSDKIES